MTRRWRATDSDHRFEYLDAAVEAGIEARCAAADALADRWPVGPLDLYDDPLLDREPVAGDRYWKDDPSWDE